MFLSEFSGNLAYNFTWPNNVTTWVETMSKLLYILPKFRPLLLAVPCSGYSARLISCRNTSELGNKVILLIYFPAIMQ
jgi:hypothetical protein